MRRRQRPRLPIRAGRVPRAAFEAGRSWTRVLRPPPSLSHTRARQLPSSSRLRTRPRRLRRRRRRGKLRLLRRPAPRRRMPAARPRPGRDTAVTSPRLHLLNAPRPLRRHRRAWRGGTRRRPRLRARARKLKHRATRRRLRGAGALAALPRVQGTSVVAAARTRGSVLRSPALACAARRLRAQATTTARTRRTAALATVATAPLPPSGATHRRRLPRSCPCRCVIWRVESLPSRRAAVGAAAAPRGDPTWCRRRSACLARRRLTRRTRLLSLACLPVRHRPMPTARTRPAASAVLVAARVAVDRLSSTLIRRRARRRAAAVRVRSECAIQANLAVVGSATAVRVCSARL
mmetsp:Transcript_7174/g.25600  ORF Transcript_7174/g.25600 Transcript_7174/m.25600 type:complete len:349 (+) Transcript_7174:3507-4553(+)